MRKVHCESCPNRRVGMICDLPSQALEDFQTISIATIYRPRQVIFSEGGPCSGLYQVCRGSVKLFHSDRFGRAHIVKVCGPGTILGEVPSDGDETFSISCEAISECQLSFLPRERLARLLERHPVTGLRLVHALSGELASARRHGRDLALKGAESRLAGLLIELAGDGGQLPSGTPVQLEYGRRDLAEMIAVSTETAIRLLGRLKDKGIISTRRRELVIKDVAKLRRIAEHEEVSVAPAAEAQGLSD